MRPGRMLTRLPKPAALIVRQKRCFKTIVTPPNSSIFRISEEVREALNSRSKPVVALESTIYTHGFPPPENMALASQLEFIVREHGGVPATIAILNGVAHVGLNAEELEKLLNSKMLHKISRRDFAGCLGDKDCSGGTTIAGTMILAHKAGIKVFATGGLGGVHRGAEYTMDISADLTELGRTPVAVVASGCKGFLDIPRTLEFLETQGVPIGTISNGRNQGPADFPAFWSRKSGVKGGIIINNEKTAAQWIRK
jgi:pseudouridylate synthase / pseudouridine kinase